MRSKLALALSAAALLAACAQSPTAPTRASAPRYDGGNSLGSGNFTDSPDSSSATGTGNSTQGGNTFGAGH